ncbi:hypothetical protein AJ78_03889 [Emergomyces pasteurianus Ep9510]|uniref:Uncharacterized protein n=1 Tax=Emergomyces pasteurianus Ep9510 TaxID=1447872 RepID=A0A1J9QL32_9EURO|nr:hypothetical protein AJ78_03889 [Emergomyces pasteurianus Ep9510]
MVSRSGSLHTLRFPHYPLLRTRFLYSGIRYSWTGSKGKDHSLEKSKRGDTTDPITKGSSGGLKEKEETRKGEDRSKSNAIAERNHEGSAKKTEEEFPEAPKPIIGMSDERGKVGSASFPLERISFCLPSLMHLADVNTPQKGT